MAITSSSFSVGQAQRDGRAFVIETHVDNIGKRYVFERLPDQDATAIT